MNETVTPPEAGQLDIYAQIMNAPDWTDANPGMLPDLSAAATSWLLRNDQSLERPAGSRRHAA